jgi:hypothetical protein
MIRHEPTMRERVASLRDEGELTGFRGQLESEGRWTKEIENLVEMRRAEIRKAKGWK